MAKGLEFGVGKHLCPRPPEPEATRNICRVVACNILLVGYHGELKVDLFHNTRII